MPHFAEDFSAGGNNALNGEAGAVGVVLGIHARIAFKVAVLECDLLVFKKLFGNFITYNKLAFAVADGDLVHLANFE